MKYLTGLILLFALVGTCFNEDTNAKPTSSASTSSNSTFSNTTQASVTSSTASPNPKIAPAPEPIPPKQSESLHFNITDKDGNICALFTFTGTIKIKEKDNNETTIYLLNATTMNAESFCTLNETSLVLNINGSNDQVRLNLETTESNKYELNLIQLVLEQAVYISNQTLFKVDNDKSYLCNADSEVLMKLKDSKDEKTEPIVHFSLQDLRIDAFRKETKNNEPRQAIQCNADYPANDFVPLAVGCALISLVFIVLIAYIVGRKRSRRLAYTSV